MLRRQSATHCCAAQNYKRHAAHAYRAQLAGCAAHSYIVRAVPPAGSRAAHSYIAQPAGSAAHSYIAQAAAAAGCLAQAAPGKAAMAAAAVAVAAAVAARSMERRQERHATAVQPRRRLSASHDCIAQPATASMEQYVVARQHGGARRVGGVVRAECANSVSTAIAPVADTAQCQAALRGLSSRQTSSVLCMKWLEKASNLICS